MTVQDVLIKKIEELEKENESLKQQIKQLTGILVIKCPRIIDGLKESLNCFATWLSDKEEGEQ